MADKNRKFSYSALIIFVLFIIAAGAAVKFYQDLKTVEEGANAGQTAYSDLEADLRFARQKAEADELFIDGDYEKALELYRAYSEEVGSDELYLRRRRAMERSDSLRYGLLAGKSESVRRATERKLREEMALADSLATLRKDSIRYAMADEINRLNNLIEEKERIIAERKPHEHLVFYSKNGNRTSYYGAVAGGKANGLGMGYYNTGNAYIGRWKDNMKHGENGVYRWIGGERYEGDYLKDKRHGEGTYYWSNGEKYEGGWEDDRRNGFGTLYDKDNNVQLKGTWKDGELIEPAK